MNADAGVDVAMLPAEYGHVFIPCVLVAFCMGAYLLLKRDQLTLRQALSRAFSTNPYRNLFGVVLGGAILLLGLWGDVAASYFTWVTRFDAHEITRITIRVFKDPKGFSDRTNPTGEFVFVDDMENARRLVRALRATERFTRCRTGRKGPLYEIRIETKREGPASTVIGLWSGDKVDPKCGLYSVTGGHRLPGQSHRTYQSRELVALVGEWACERGFVD